MKASTILYVILLVVWNLLAYACLIHFSFERWPLCWDFIHYYQCGAMALSPDRFHVYDPQVQLAWTNKIISPQHVTELWFIQFVPFVFPLMVPFALMGLGTSYLVWCVISIASGSYILFQTLTERKWPAPAIFAFLLAATACFPAWFNVWWGQFAWFYLTLMGLYFLSLKRKKDILAGICLALLAIKPQYIFPVAFPALFLKRTKLIVTAVCTELLLLGLAAFSIGTDSVLNYHQTLLSAEKQAGQMQANAGAMISLRGLFSAFLPSEIALYAAAFLYLAALVLLFFIWRKATRESDAPDSFNWPIALTIMTAILFSPHSMVYDCLIVFIAAALTLPGYQLSDVDKLVDSAGSKLAGFANRFWFYSLYFYPIISWLIFLPLSDNDTKPFAKVYALFDALLLAAGIIRFFQTTKQKVNED